MNEEEIRKIGIKENIKTYQGQIKFFRDLINDLKRELDFMNGNYDKTWEEEYGDTNVSKEDDKGGLGE